MKNIVLFISILWVLSGHSQRKILEMPVDYIDGKQMIGLANPSNNTFCFIHDNKSLYRRIIVFDNELNLINSQLESGYFKPLAILRSDSSFLIYYDASKDETAGRIELHSISAYDNSLQTSILNFNLDRDDQFLSTFNDHENLYVAFFNKKESYIKIHKVIENLVSKEWRFKLTQDFFLSIYDQGIYYDKNEFFSLFKKKGGFFPMSLLTKETRFMEVEERKKSYYLDSSSLLLTIESFLETLLIRFHLEDSTYISANQFDNLGYKSNSFVYNKELHKVQVRSNELKYSIHDLDQDTLFDRSYEKGSIFDFTKSGVEYEKNSNRKKIVRPSEIFSKLKKGRLGILVDQTDKDQLLVEIGSTKYASLRLPWVKKDKNYSKRTSFITFLDPSYDEILDINYEETRKGRIDNFLTTREEGIPSISTSFNGLNGETILAFLNIFNQKIEFFEFN